MNLSRIDADDNWRDICSLKGEEIPINKIKIKHALETSSEARLSASVLLPFEDLFAAILMVDFRFVHCVLEVTFLQTVHIMTLDINVFSNSRCMRMLLEHKLDSLLNRSPSE